ncbi:hypothetical protein ACFX10_003339 [Malus domestica]
MEKTVLIMSSPPEVSTAEGAGLPVAALTAHKCLTESTGIKLNRSGQQKNILITAAFGGVSQYAVLLQLEYTDLYSQQAEEEKQQRRCPHFHHACFPFSEKAKVKQKRKKEKKRRK